MTATLELLATFALGLLAGAMLLVGVAFVPFWASLPPAEFSAWFRDNADLIGRLMIPLGASAMVLTAAAAFAAHRAARAGAFWFTVAAALALAVAVSYPVFFTAMNAAFASGTLPPDQLTAELASWRWRHAARTAAGILGFMAALRGLAVSQR
jgi:hypothetical protein